MINRIISSERSKWIFIIGVVAISAGLTVRNVISYPTECMSEEVVQNLDTPQSSKRNFTIF